MAAHLGLLSRLSGDCASWLEGRGTTGTRLAWISSFYRFLMRMEIVSSNPCDQLQRPKVSPDPAKGFSADQIKMLLYVIPETPNGLRDRAIILTLTLTGRRCAEVLNLKAGDISIEGGIYYSYRGKGGKRGKRELPRPAFDAINSALAAFGKDLATMRPVESLWPSKCREGGLTAPA